MKNTSQDHFLGGVSVIFSAAGYQTSLFAELPVFWMLDDSLDLGKSPTSKSVTEIS